MAILIRIISKQAAWWCQSSSHPRLLHTHHNLKLQTAAAAIITSTPCSLYNVSSSRLPCSSSSSSPPTTNSSSSSSNENVIVANPTTSTTTTSSSSSSGSSSSESNTNNSDNNNNTNTNNSNSRPFRILGLQQIAIGSLTKEPTLHLWTHIFGLPKIGSYISIQENVNEDILLLGECCDKSTTTTASAIEIDLMIPIDPTKTPKVHIPSGLHHIGLWVDDLQSAVTWMTAQGVRFTPGGIRPGASGYNVTFIHPKGNTMFPIGGENVLIELVQAPLHVIKAFTNTTTTTTTTTATTTT